MDIRKPLLLLLLICVLLLEVDGARPKGRLRAQARAGGRGRVRNHNRGHGRGHSRGRVRGRGRPKGRKPVVSKAPERIPVYLELPGEENPIPVFPLAPGSGHQPFTVKVLSPHLDGPEDPVQTPSKASSEVSSEEPRRPTSQVPSSFAPPESVQPFTEADTGAPAGSLRSRPSGVPASLSGSSGAGFFESGDEFGRSPPSFPSFETVFGGSTSRGRRGRRLFPPAEVSGVTAQLPHSVDKESSDSKDGGGPEEPYEYGYVVDGRRQSGAAFGLHQASADGLTRGRYEVQLPDGRTQVVTYTAGGKRGYEAEVEYIGEADTAATYGF